MRTARDISLELGIGLSTFYNYEKELDLPKVRVGIGLASRLPREKALQDLKSRDEYYELTLLQALAQETGLRMKLVPCFSGDNSAISLVSQGRLDFVISSLSKTRERARNLYFSHSYYESSTPWGQLIRLKKLKPVRRKTSKARLGVVRLGVHEDHALRFLRPEFEIVSARTIPENLKRLSGRKIDFILAHPSIFELYPGDTQNMEITSMPYAYDSHTGIVFNADSEFWRPLVNKGIARLQEKGLLQK